MKFNVKNLLSIFLIQFVFGGAFAQEKNSEQKTDDSEEFVQVIVDEPAEYPGGMEAMNRFINENLDCPEVASKNGITGKCYLLFVINKEGIVSNVKVRRGVAGCPECDAEAIRVIKSMPKWIPAKADGENENYLFAAPVSFECGLKTKN